MPLTETGTLTADELMVDDWVEVGGTTFRIKELSKDGNKIRIEMYNPDTDLYTATLVVERIQTIKVFNQK